MQEMRIQIAWEGFMLCNGMLGLQLDAQNEVERQGNAFQATDSFLTIWTKI